MSFNQSKSDKSSDSHYRRTGRSTNVGGNQRGFSGPGGGKGGGGSGSGTGNAPPPLSTNSSTANRSFKKTSNGQGGQSRVGVPNSNSELSYSAAAASAPARPGQNGSYVQPSLSGVSDAPASAVATKPTNPSAPRSNRPVPKAPSSQPTAGASESVAPSTPAKADMNRAFQLQFGSISPGVVNGMQIPARTCSAPPNLDEQKRDQARHDSLRAAPTMPIPPAIKQQPLKDAGIKQSPIGEPHATSTPSRRDVNSQVPSTPGTTACQKHSVLAVPGASKPMQYPSQVPMPFGGPNTQIQSQGITAASLQMPMPLQGGSSAHVPQQMFVQGIQPHPIPTQGMMPQGPNLNFAAQMSHQLAPQMGNMGIGISPQFQQQAGTYGVPRKTVKITHPETHEELRLDKKTDPYTESGSSGSKSHPNAPPQSQQPSFSPHQISYYPPLFYSSTQNQVSLPGTQINIGSQPRYTYPVAQGSPAISVKNPATLGPSPAAKNGSLVNSAAEASKLEHPHYAQAVTSIPATSAQVTVKPPLSTPIASGDESAKLAMQPTEVGTNHLQRGSDTGSENSIHQSKSVLEPAVYLPSSASGKHSIAASTAVSVQRLPTSTSSSISSPPSEELATVITNTEGKQREPVRRSESFKDQQKKAGREDMKGVQLQHQEAASNPMGTSKSFSPRISTDVPIISDTMQSPPSEMAELSPATMTLPSQGLESISSLKDGNSVDLALIGASRGVSGGRSDTSTKMLPGARFGHDGSEVVADGRQNGDGDVSCASLNKSDLQPEGNISDKVDGFQPARQDLGELQLKQECSGTVEGKTELSESTKQGSKISDTCKESSVGNNQIDTNTDLKSTANKGSGFVGLEQKSEGTADPCISEVEGMADPLKVTVTIPDSADAALSSYILSTSAHDDKTSPVGTSTSSSDMSNSEEVSVICSTTDSHPDLTTVPSDILRHELKNTDIISTGAVSASVSGFKDKPPSETSKVKTAGAKGKKKRKDILKAADAAGSTSDLYMAYKGRDEKQDNAVSENIDSSLSVDAKQVPTDDVEKGLKIAKEDGQTKAEPDDWEDAADMSTPKLESGVGEPDQGSADQNEDGKSSKKYSRDFLLTLSEQCTDLPTGFEIGSDIAKAIMSVQVASSHLVDREICQNSGRIIDRQSGGSRPDRRGSGVVDDDKWSKSPGHFVPGRDPRMDGAHGAPVGNFRPGQGGNHSVLRHPRGPTGGQYNGGIISGPMQSMSSQGGMQRTNSDGDRWPRSKGLIPSPQTPSQVMHKAETKYEIRKVSDIEVAKQRQLKAILNKLTPQNFEKLFEQVKEVNIDNTVTLSGVISQIFDKALMEPTFCEMYANFCFHLAGELPDFSEDNEKITFKRLLLNKCQEEFERGEREQAEANRVEEEGEVKCSVEEREEKRVQARRRMLGNIRLIGELYKKKMLTERIMHECIQKLLGQHQNPDEEDIESLCKLMSTIGEMIDHPKAKDHMDAYFDIMTQLSNNMKISSRVRFMLKDSIDLRRNKWQQRRKVEGPKKIDEVHRDAAQERQAQATRLARGPSISSSARRGPPSEFGYRGSTVLSSPNSQMGGLRAFPPQVRGYAQDVRMEERHPYESRTLSVPLSQRPIDDNSITLGPQGGLARGMSARGQPLMPGIPLGDIPPPVDPRRLAAGQNGHSSPYAREEILPRYAPERSMPMQGYDQSNLQERNLVAGNRDLRSTERTLDRPLASFATHVHGISTLPPAQVDPEKVWPEEHLRDVSISTIREYYSAKDKGEVALCIKELNCPSSYPSVVSIWITDSFERKDMERDLLAKLLADLTKSSPESLLNQVQLIKGFEAVLSTLEDAVNDAPKAGEFLGGILAKVILENVVPLREVCRLIQEGGEEPGRLLQIGLASEVLASILEIIRREKGEDALKEIRTSSNLRLEDFRPPDPLRSRKLEAFF